MGSDQVLIIIVVQGVICGVLSGVIARSKGRDATAWFFAGLLFGIFGLIAAAGIGKQERTLSKNHDLRKCPYCAEFIRLDAVICRFCGRDVPRSSEPSSNEMENIDAPAQEQTDERPPNGLCQSCGAKMHWFQSFYKRGGLIVCSECNVVRDFPIRESQR